MVTIECVGANLPTQVIDNLQTFNFTDVILQTVNTWPDTGPEVYFESKLKFQIQHSIFRTKVHEIVSFQGEE